MCSKLVFNLEVFRLVLCVASAHFGAIGATFRQILDLRLISSSDAVHSHSLDSGEDGHELVSTWMCSISIVAAFTCSALFYFCWGGSQWVCQMYVYEHPVEPFVCSSLGKWQARALPTCCILYLLERRISLSKSVRYDRVPLYC